MSDRIKHAAKAAGALPIVIVGHVDHGKSTLIGRLLHDTGSLPDGKVEAIRAMAHRRGMATEWAYVMDAFQAERDQGITIDTTQIHFRTRKRPYVIIDAPGHKEFLKNMISGAASADAALLVVDAAEGVLEQTRRHAYLLHLLGVPQVGVVVNKMDVLSYDRAGYERVVAELGAYLDGIGLEAAAFIPVTARDGVNVGRRSDLTPWYDGPTVVELLDRFESRHADGEQALRLPVQDVYRFDDRRLIAGRLESGRIRVGDELAFAPTGKRARIKSIESWNRHTPQISAIAGQSVAITLDDELFLERGQIAHHPDAAPLVANSLRVRIVWLGREPLVPGKRLRLRLGTGAHAVTVARVESVLDLADLSSSAADTVPPNAIAEVVVHSRTPIVADGVAEAPRTGRGVLLDRYAVVGGFVVQEPAVAAHHRNLHAVAHTVTEEARAHANGHRGGIIWFTGLSGAGKSTIAMALERDLFLRGYQVVVLDGDNLRQGLNTDLDFLPEARGENIRRVAEVAKLFAQAGMLVVTAFISPYRADRDRARTIAGSFLHEAFIDAPLDVCEARDPKGLYAKARAGEIADFTGVDAPYEPPLAPDVVVNTADHGIEACVATLTGYVDRAFGLDADEDRGVA